MRLLKPLLLLLVLSFQNVYASITISNLEKALWSGKSDFVINQGEILKSESLLISDKLEILGLLSEAYLQINNYSKHLSSIREKRELNPNETNSNILYFIELANYYHHQLRIDSSLFYAGESMKLFLQTKDWTDSNLVYNVYSKYGNCCRNSGTANFNKVASSNVNPMERNTILNSFEDTALLFTTNDFQKADVYHKKATIYLDVVAGYDNTKIKSDMEYTLVQSNNNYLRSIEHSRSSTQQGSAYSLIGLNHHYFKHYELSNKYYDLAINTLSKDLSINLFKLVAALNWKGWNLEEWYGETNDVTKLNEAIDSYEQNITNWDVYSKRKVISNTGSHDAYRIAAHSKLAVSYYRKFLISKDSSFLNKSFKHSDLAKYPNYPATRISIKDIQKKLLPNQVFIQNNTSTHPYTELKFIIHKTQVTTILNDSNIVSLPYYQMNELFQFSDLKLFKKWSHLCYSSIFKDLESTLEKLGITHIIFSNSDYNSMLNYDLLISDTLSSSWKTQPYLFHRFCFSYSLCARSFLDKKTSVTPPINLGVSIGDFSEEVDLRFSKQLVENLTQDYQGKTSSITSNLRNNNVAIIVGHGNSSYAKYLGGLCISKDSVYSVKDVFHSTYTNDFILVTACNSNQSQTNFGEGSSGNFSKAFIYAGAKSTLTTSWEIDDKSNAYIIEKFIGYLSDGIAKNDALWKAKKDYWNQSQQEEAFKPLYWAPYILTGETSPVKIQKRNEMNYAWLGLLLLIPIGYVHKKKRA